MHVVLVGPMGVGKTRIGKMLAARLGRPLRDSDADLEASGHIRGRELAATEGVDALHVWEADHLLRSLASPEPSVIAAAASVVDDPHLRRLLRVPYVVWLRASAEALAARVSPTDHRRPLAPGEDQLTAIEALDAERAPRFAEVSDIALDTERMPVEDIVRTVLEALPPDAQRIGVRSPDRAPGP